MQPVLMNPMGTMPPGMAVADEGDETATVEHVDGDLEGMGIARAEFSPWLDGLAPWAGGLGLASMRFHGDLPKPAARPDHLAAGTRRMRLPQADSQVCVRHASEITDSGDWDSRMGSDGRTWADNPGQDGVEWGAEWDAGWRGDSSWQEDAGWRGDSSWQEWRGWWWYRDASGDWVEWQNPWRVQAHMLA